MFSIEQQIEASKRYLFGSREPRDISDSDEAYGRYFPPSGMEVIKCYEDVNGEWVPEPVESRNGGD